MKPEIKNCGLIALSNIIEIEKISFRSLIFTAKDNGLKLFPYEIDFNEINKVELPAIFHTDNHFVCITDVGQFKDHSFTGYILHTKRQPYYVPINQNKLKHITGASWIAVGVGAASAIAGGIKANQAKKDKKRAKRDAENLKEVPLNNVANELKVSTIGAKNRQEGQSVLEATQTAALQEAGTRAIIGGAGRVAAGSQDVNKDIAGNLDEQQKNIDMIGAEDNIRIRSTKEQRNQSKLAAISSQYNAAADAEQQGYGNMIQGAGMAGSAASNKWGGTSGTTSKFSGSGTDVPQNIGWTSKYKK